MECEEGVSGGGSVVRGVGGQTMPSFARRYGRAKVDGRVRGIEEGKPLSPRLAGARPARPHPACLVRLVRAPEQSGATSGGGFNGPYGK